MSVYRREAGGQYYYDFRMDGQRFSGPTGSTDRAEAIAAENRRRAESHPSSPLCRTVLRSARKGLAQPRRGGYGYVYMIRSGYFIKIGHSVEPTQRLKTIATATPETCELILLIPGSKSLERRLHAEFEASHYRGEWFFHCGKLKIFAAELMRERKQKLPQESHENDKAAQQSEAFQSV